MPTSWNCGELGATVTTPVAPPPTLLTVNSSSLLVPPVPTLPKLPSGGPMASSGGATAVPVRLAPVEPAASDSTVRVELLAPALVGEKITDIEHSAPAGSEMSLQPLASAGRRNSVPTTVMVSLPLAAVVLVFLTLKLNAVLEASTAMVAKSCTLGVMVMAAGGTPVPVRLVVMVAAGRAADLQRRGRHADLAGLVGHDQGAGGVGLQRAAAVVDQGEVVLAGAGDGRNDRWGVLLADRCAR